MQNICKQNDEIIPFLNQTWGRNWFSHVHICEVIGPYHLYLSVQLSKYILILQVKQKRARSAKLQTKTVLSAA